MHLDTFKYVQTRLDNIGIIAACIQLMGAVGDFKFWHKSF